MCSVLCRKVEKWRSSHDMASVVTTWSVSWARHGQCGDYMNGVVTTWSEW